MKKSKNGKKARKALSFEENSVQGSPVDGTTLISSQALNKIRKELSQSSKNKVSKNILISINEILAVGTACGFILGTIGFVSLESFF